MKKISKAIATVFGIGYLPGPPGTFASIFCLIFFWLMPPLPIHYWAIVILALFFIGVWVSFKAAEPGNHDPSFIVIDEFVGQLIAVAAFEKSIGFIVGGFILFRLFDITKWPPVGYGEKLPGGWGVMMDDVIAGVIGALILLGISQFI